MSSSGALLKLSLSSVRYGPWMPERGRGIWSQPPAPPINKCREAERKDLVLQGDVPVCSGLSGPTLCARPAASCSEPSSPPSQSSVSSSVDCMKALPCFPQSTWPAAVVGHCTPCPSDLCSSRLVSGLFIMPVPQDEVHVSFCLDYDPQKGPHH